MGIELNYKYNRGEEGRVVAGNLSAHRAGLVWCRSNKIACSKSIPYRHPVIPAEVNGVWMVGFWGEPLGEFH